MYEFTSVIRVIFLRNASSASAKFAYSTQRNFVKRKLMASSNFQAYPGVVPDVLPLARGTFEWTNLC